MTDSAPTPVPQCQDSAIASAFATILSRVVNVTVHDGPDDDLKSDSKHVRFNFPDGSCTDLVALHLLDGVEPYFPFPARARA